MRNLRKIRRMNNECAECGNPSSFYSCSICKAKRKNAQSKREELRLREGLCILCGQREVSTDKGLCVTCSRIHPNLPIRKLRSWKVTNHRLYNAMMNKPCSTKELALHVGVNERSVCSWLFENATPKEFNASKVALFFNMRIDELF